MPIISSRDVVIIVIAIVIGFVVISVSSKSDYDKCVDAQMKVYEVMFPDMTSEDLIQREAGAAIECTNGAP